MKKIIVFSMFLMVSARSFGQQKTSSPVLTKQDYLQKSKHQKKAAWIMLGGGTTLFVVGGLVGAHGLFDFYRLQFDNADAKIELSGILALTGTAAMLASVPFFIASSKNKKKAMSMSFKNETATQLQNNNFVYKPIPSLALKIIF